MEGCTNFLSIIILGDLNPAGANLTLSEFFRTNERKQLIFCLNDLLADGEDISWIWDIDMDWLTVMR
ncbi:MurT ligase domain-containing protein [Neobacillus ginsengisoli]|uniref:MurT ligase domain-containing protein n=1 Tax=Neobacillus ginsengisoli TaxID=904295 RepID=UPI00351F883F